MNKKTVILLLLLALLSLPALKALAIPGFYTSHDGSTHTARIANFYLALKEGQLPPRLAPTLFGNLGYPIFLFIYPLPYFLGAFFRFLGAGFTDAFELVVALGFLLSAWTMFLFAKELFGRLPAFMAALFYTWAPYRFSQIYVRAAIAESFAYLFVPLVLLSLVKLARVGDKNKFDRLRWIGWGGLSLAGVLLSHQLVALMFLPVFAAFFLVFWLASRRKAAYFLSGAGMGILGFAVSAYIYLPALFERNYLKFDSVISYWSDHFVTPFQLIHSPWSYGFSLPGTAGDDMSFQVGLTQLLVVFLAFLLLAYRLAKSGKKTLANFENRIAGLGLFFFAFSVVLMLECPLTRWLWATIPGISIVDFPWRWLGVAVFGASLLAAYLTTLRKPLLMVVIFCLLFYANRNHLRINKTEIFPDSYFLNYQSTATWKNEFLPKWRESNDWNGLKNDFDSSDGEMKVNPVISQTGRLKFRVDAPVGGTLQINRLYFPGWEVSLDGRRLALDAGLNITQGFAEAAPGEPRIDRSGLMAVEVPAGEHEIEAVFRETPLRKLGIFLSALGLFTAVVLVFSAKFGNLPKIILNKNKQ